MFTPNLAGASSALDLALDAGFGKFAPFSNPSDFPFGGNEPVIAMVGLNLGLVWGL